MCKSKLEGITMDKVATIKEASSASKKAYKVGKKALKGLGKLIDKSPRTAAGVAGGAAAVAGYGVGKGKGKKEMGQRFAAYNRQENQAIAKKFYMAGRQSAQAKTASQEQPQEKIAFFSKAKKGRALKDVATKALAATGLAAGVGGTAYGGYRYGYDKGGKRGYRKGARETATVLSDAFRSANARENQAIANSFKRYNQRENRALASAYMRRGIEMGRASK
jgi:hypothetical protein